MIHVFDGVKQVPLSSLPEEAWEYLTGGPIDEADVEEMYKGVPWFFRGVHLRANGVRKIPWALMRGDQDFETSRDYQNKLGWWNDPKTTLYIIEAAMSVYGAAYLFKKQNIFITQGLRYIVPSSVKPVISKKDGLTGFERTIENQPIRFQPEDFVYFFAPDPFKEVGPGTPPAMAALTAAGVLNSTDQFAKNFFERGAIKATLLTVKPPLPAPQELSRLEAWWRRFFRGEKNAWEAAAVSAEVEPKVVGEGISELANVALTNEKREAVATAFGVPHSLLFSNATNFATAQQDKLNFYEDTVIPEAEYIAEVLNTQLFEAMNLRLVFRPEEMPIFQEDEEQRSGALVNLVNSGLPLDVALAILGFDLTDDQWQQIQEEKEAKEERANLMAQRLNGGGGRDDDDEDGGARPVAVPQQQNGDNGDTMRAHLDLYQKKAMNRVKRGRSPAVSFQSEKIPVALGAAIRGALEEAQDGDDVKEVFENIWLGYP